MGLFPWEENVTSRKGGCFFNALGVWGKSNQPPEGSNPPQGEKKHPGVSIHPSLEVTLLLQRGEENIHPLTFAGITSSFSQLSSKNIFSKKKK